MKKQSKIRQALNPQKILFLTSILLSTLFLSSCNSGSKDSIQSSKGSTESTSLSETQNTSQDSLVHFLLDAAAKDFHEYQPPVPLGFRNVQIKYLTEPNEEKTYIMCGQFLDKDDQDKEEWVHFVTIKTDPYEQWIGSNALGYCQDSKEITYTKIDLTIALKSKYDSLQKSSK